MAGMQARAATAAGQGGVRTSAAEPPRRYDPSMYTHLKSWETPLPPPDEEPEKEERSTLPLASGSTQLWSQTVRAGGSVADEGGEFTSLLHQGLRDDDGGGVDLRFGLCSGGGREASRTFIIDGDRSACGLEHGGSLHTEQSTLRRAAPVLGTVGPSPTGRQHGSTAPSAERLTQTWPACTAVAAGSLRMGGARSPMPACTTPIESEVRDEGTCRAPIHPRPTVENITRGVSNMRAHNDGGEDDGGFGDDADEGMREDVEAGDDDDDATEEDTDDNFTTEDEQGEATASAARESGRQRSSDQSASKMMFTPPPEVQQLRVRETWKEKGVVVDLGGDDDDPLEKRRLRNATQATPAAVSTARAATDERPITVTLPNTPSQPRQCNDGADGASVQCGGGGVVVADARAAGGEAAGGAGVGVAGVVDPIPAAREEGAVPTMQAISCAAAVENIALRILHDSVLKSGNRPRGYHLAFQYSLESVATDIARAMWYGEEWCNVVSAAICAHTIDLNMDLPLWYAGAHIEDRLEDNDMAAHEESTVIQIAHSFRTAVQMGAHIDDDFISYERLCRVADCFRLLLAASMWIMRMAGDDPRSHYEAFYFADLVARPTLVASIHRSFDHRRFVVRATNVVTERLGKAKATLGVYPEYIPDWAPCGIGFADDASIKGPEDVKRLDWLGSGPLDDKNKGEGKDDA
ncbi:hypothetical protein CBR_g21169 [Chara braunii]|uniref:Uncharacterized protein n=1 Tax=Chara braunii TaxID=69332 RepID=A0A388L0V2_CHABU|nr:hypothetical protein CBR_g21169 [Chara braunii]|eukprot:GBG75927.1 hypothetical protein CBR_g21169 [Chara braunii]